MDIGAARPRALAAGLKGEYLYARCTLTIKQVGSPILCPGLKLSSGFPQKIRDRKSIPDSVPGRSIRYVSREAHSLL